MGLISKSEYWYHKFENAFASILLFTMALLPTAEIFLRKIFNTGISGSTIYVQHMTLWVGFIGAVIATRDKRHLSLSPTVEFLPEKLRPAAVMLKNIITTAVCSALFFASLSLVKAELNNPMTLANWLPSWVLEIIMPVGFGIMTLRFAYGATKGAAEKAIASMGIIIVIICGLFLAPYAAYLTIPFVIVLILGAIVGAPIFIVLGGLAAVFFFANGVPIASISAETYRIVSSPVLPTIPLFTLAGYLLAEGGASKRMIKLFSALFGWMPGGLAIATILVCTFFTTFTGASGVTILAMGGLLLPILIHSGYRKEFAVGLLTATGSLGLLFPPSLPVILYGVFSGTSILDLFKGGVLPGVLLVFVVIIFAIGEGIKSKVKRTPFVLKEAVASLWESKWEVVIPFLVLGGIFGGFATIVEAAAITAIYAFIVEAFIYKDINVFKDLPHILLKCVILIGGVLIILGVAMGLTSFIVDAEIPMKIADWTAANIHSPYLFLLILNIVLLVVGCLMDIFSALVVVVPLITPIAQKFGIDPVHLGIIFIANLELGYLTPPVGMNLFLSAYRFDQTVGQVTKSTYKFLVLMFVAVIIITYFPILTTGMVRLLR